MTVGQLVQDMDYSEYVHWQVLAMVELEEQEQPARRKVTTDPAEIRRFFARMAEGGP